MSDKVVIEITKDELEILRNLDAAMGVAGSNISKALTHREKRLIKEMVSQHPEPLEDGIYVYVRNMAVQTAFVKDGQWDSALNSDDNSLILPRPLTTYTGERWTRVADLPEDEWL